MPTSWATCSTPSGTCARSSWSWILTGRQIWCDDIRTDADRDLRRARGGRAGCGAARPGAAGSATIRTAWRWGDAHVARMTHPVFGGPAAARPAVRHRGRRAAATASRSTSGTSIRATSGGRSPAPMRATYRAIYDLADLDASRFVTATGQSGNPLSRHYRDLTTLWATGGSVPIERDRASYRQGADRDACVCSPPASRPRRARGLRPLVAWALSSRPERAGRSGSRFGLSKFVNNLWIKEIFPLSVVAFWHARSDPACLVSGIARRRGFRDASVGCRQIRQDSVYNSHSGADLNLRPIGGIFL